MDGAKWPGIFIPGDEALGLAHLMRMLADQLQEGFLDPTATAAFLRVTAMELEQCQVSAN